MSARHRQVGETVILTATPTVDAATNYASGDNMGGKISLTVGSEGGLINSVVIGDLAAQEIQIDAIFFRADPSATTFTDNAALDIDDADLDKIIGAVTVNTWFSFSDSSVGVTANVALPFVIDSGSTLYCALVSRGAHNLASTSDIKLGVGILLD